MAKGLVIGAVPLTLDQPENCISHRKETVVQTCGGYYYFGIYPNSHSKSAVGQDLEHRQAGTPSPVLSLSFLKVLVLANQGAVGDDQPLHFVGSMSMYPRCLFYPDMQSFLPPSL